MENNIKCSFVFAISQRNNGGAERAICQLANVVYELGYSVEFVQLFSNDDDYYLNSNILVHCVPQPKIRNKLLRRAIHIIRAIEEIRKVNATYLIPMLEVMTYIGYFATRFSKTKLIATIRNNPFELPSNRIERGFRDFICNCADGIFVQNEEQKKYFKLKVQKKTFIVPNIINEAFLERTIKRKNTVRNFVAAGRLNYQKNYAYLIRSFSKLTLTNGCKDCTLTIFGQGPEEKNLRVLIKQLNLNDRVYLAGRCDELYEKYMDYDAFVLSSDFEGMPNALMEAMAIGFPCISTNCKTGPADLIKNGETGYLVECGNENQMADAMHRYILNPYEAYDIGLNAKKYVCSMFGKRNIGVKFVYECMQR